MRSTKLLKYLSILLFSGMLFSFLHSEMGFFKHAGDDHSQHDYSQLISRAETGAYIINSSKQIYNKVEFTVLPQIEVIRVSLSYNSEEYPPNVDISPHLNSDLYLTNRLLLI